MGMERHETTVVSSSITLLQERFRQLERVKEMREERELLRNDTKQLEPPSRLFFHSDLIVPRRPSRHVSLSPWPAFETRYLEDQLCHCCTSDHELLVKKLWRLDASMSPFGSKLGFDEARESDVDTSLHL